MKKFVLIFIIVSIFVYGFCWLMPVPKVYATTNDSENLEEELNESINLQLEALDLDSIEDVYNDFIEYESLSFYDFLQSVLNGDISFSFSTVYSLVINNCLSTIKSKYRLLVMILIISFLSSLISNMVIGKNSSEISSSISFIFVVFVAGLICYSVVEVVNNTSTALLNISKLTEVVSPVILALMVSIGAVSSSALYQPAISAMTTIVIDICSNFLLGLIVFMFAITILGSLVDSFKLDKINQFCSSLLKWIIGIVFTLFIGYLSIQGVTASGYDGLSIKTAKYAIRSYIPMVGGYLSEGFEIFRGGSILIKNSLGLVGVITLISIVLSPILELIVLNLTFKFAGSLSEIMGAGKIANLLTGVTRIFTYLTALIFAVFMMCFIIFLLIIMTANIV